ncbi:MAG: hypothetical protein GY830_00470 [Bacteroidetes bacterium]|nr:hypothetical protein [Bacteroidota bacterium]
MIKYLVYFLAFVSCSKTSMTKMEKSFEVSFKNKKDKRLNYEIMNLEDISNCKFIQTNLESINFINNLCNAFDKSMFNFFPLDILSCIKLPLSISELIIQYYVTKKESIIFAIPNRPICSEYNCILKTEEFSCFTSKKHSSKKIITKLNLKFIEKSSTPFWFGTIPPYMIPINFDNCIILEYSNVDQLF